MARAYRAAVLSGLILLTCAVSASAQVMNATTAKVATRAVIGGTTFGDVLRIVGSSTVSSGTGTMNPFVIDSDGDGLEDTTTTVSTAGAWNHTVLFTLGAGLNITGNVTPASGTLPIIGALSTTGDIAINGNDLTSTGVLNVRPTGSLTFDPTGDIIIDADGKDLLPFVNYDQNVGSISKKILTLHAAELWVETLVAHETMATIGGRILVGPTSVLLSDLASGGTTVRVKHNSFRVGDVARLEAGGKLEFVTFTAGPSRQTSGCGTLAECWDYTITRNLDGTGANDWYAGDAIFAGCGRTNDGCMDLYSLRGALAVGYPDEVLADAPEAYLRLNEASGTSAADATGHGYGATVGGSSHSFGAGDAINDGGTSLFLNGTAYVTFPAASRLASLTGTATWEGWFNFSGLFSAGYRTIMSKGTSWDIDVNTSGALLAIHNAGAESLTIANAGALTDGGAWNHLAIVRDSAASNYKVYVNGALVKTTAYTVTPTSNATGIRIGATSAGSQILNGWIDDISISDRALTAEEISQHYAATTTSTRTVYRAGPTIAGLIRTGSNFQDVSERWAIGNLSGLYGYTDTVYGFAAGNHNQTWISADASNGFRIMSGNDVKMHANTAGDLYLQGLLSISTAGHLTSGKTACGTGVGIWLAYNSGNPQACFGDSDDYLHWDGTTLEVASNNFSIQSGGVFVNPRTVSTWATDYGYNFNSSFSGDKPAMWSYETASERAVRVDNKTTQSGRTSRIALAVDDEDTDAAALTITTGLAASASDADIQVSGVTFTVSSNNIVVRGNTGLNTTVVVPCGTLTFTSGVLTNKGAC